MPKDMSCKLSISEIQSYPYQTSCSRQYGDPRYTAWVSGYRPQLDSIQIYQQTEYITKEVKVATKPKRLGIGLQTGYGVSLHNGQLFPAPYIGVGLSYSIINW